MDKQAFIPFTPIKIDDKKDYNSPTGTRKRELNESISRVTGAGVGLAAGAAAGTIAAYILSKMAPGKLGIPMNVFRNTQAKSGYSIGKGYANRVMAQTGAYPKSMPPMKYMPLLGAIAGGAAGIFPAEYKAKTNMQRSVGIDPVMAKKEFRHKDVYPTLGAVALGVTAAGIAEEALSSMPINKLTTSAKWYKNYPAMGALGIGLATEVAAEKQLSKLFNKDKENTMDKKASAQDLYEKIASEAFAYGYAMEMDALTKEAEFPPEDPKKEDPPAEEPKKDTPPAEDPKPEEPKKDEPKAEEPKKDESGEGCKSAGAMDILNKIAAQNVTK